MSRVKHTKRGDTPNTPSLRGLRTRSGGRSNPVLRGDTVVEVIFAITIFCLVAIISITLMNSGISTAQGSLELTMARNEIDAQAEALRFIQNGFLAERELPRENQQYTDLWRRITRDELDCDYDSSVVNCGLAIQPERLADFDLTTCAEAYESPEKSIFENNAFVINTRLVQPSDTDAGLLQDFFNGSSLEPNYGNLINDIIISSRRPNTFISAPLYPRLLFTHHGYGLDSDLLVETDGQGNDQLYRVVASVEGIWVIAVRGGIQDLTTNEPEFFDFYIRTCWYEPGNDYPTAIGTIVRLYNPEVVE